MTKLEELKVEAKDLGLTHSTNIGEKALAAKIEAHYQTKSTQTATSVDDIDENATVETIEKALKAKAYNPKLLARQREAEARKTRVITIIDNDQRQNNTTTSCTVNCSNQHFDLGTAILPLNMEVEVKLGHIEALSSVKIPHHTTGANGLASRSLRKRYSISYADLAVK